MWGIVYYAKVIPEPLFNKQSTSHFLYLNINSVLGVGPSNIFNMRLIILSGEDNCGKTTTLNSLANKIKIGGLYLKEKIPKGNPQQKDFDYVFYKNPDYSGKPIIISTWGDYPQLLQECCEKYNDAELIVCACNMKFMHGRKFKPFVDAMKYDRFATVV